MNTFFELGHPKPKWVSKDDSNKYSKNDLIALHRTWTQEQISHLDFFYKYQNFYSTLLLALITAYITLLLQYYNSILVIILGFIPVSMIILSYLGIKAINRYFERYLESVVHIAKIENLLLIDMPPIRSEAGIPEESPWPSDPYFIVKRFIDSRFDDTYPTSAEWKKAKMKEVDISRAHTTFWFFIVTALIFLTLTFLFALNNTNIIDINQFLNFNQTKNN